jgi:hypothetical protein
MENMIKRSEDNYKLEEMIKRPEDNDKLEDMIKQPEESYKLILLTEEYIEPLFHWNMEEKSFEYYTCRPLKLCKSLKEYTGKTLEEIYRRK